MTDQQRTRVRIPADVDREDRLLARLTARQVAILAATGIALWLAFLATDTFVPGPVFFGAAVPVAGVAVVLAFGRRDGVSLDRLAWAALRQSRAPRRLVVAPDGVTPPPAWVDSNDTTLPAPLRLPAHAIHGDGTVDLGVDGVAVVLACSTVSFALLTDTEQEALITGLARWLHSLTDPVQILVRTERVSVDPLVDRLTSNAPGLPHLALEHAALDHARFLQDLARVRDLRTRQILLVLRQPTPPGGDMAAAVDQVTRRIDTTVQALRGFSVTAHVLDGPTVTRVLGDVCDPYASAAVGTPTAVVTRERADT